MVRNTGSLEAATLQVCTLDGWWLPHVYTDEDTSPALSRLSQSHMTLRENYTEMVGELGEENQNSPCLSFYEEP